MAQNVGTVSLLAVMTVALCGANGQRNWVLQLPVNNGRQPLHPAAPVWQTSHTASQPRQTFSFDLSPYTGADGQRWNGNTATIVRSDPLPELSPQPTTTIPSVEDSQDYVVSRGEFPYMVSLRGEYGHFCGGVLITPSHVLTAARCVTRFSSDFNDQFTAVVGIVLQPEASVANSIKIKRAIHHTDYTNSVNNIAILKLANSTPNTVIAVPRSNLASRTAIVPSGQWLTAVGWDITGPEEYPRPSVPYQLYKTQLRVARPEECAAVAGYDGKSTAQLCTASHNLTVCRRDEGGPVVNVQNGRHTLVGLVGTATHGCPVGEPVVLTNVRHYADWIAAAVEASDDANKRFPEGKCWGDCDAAAPVQPRRLSQNWRSWR